MKVFTLEEARQVLDLVKEAVDRINAKKAELAEYYEILESDQDELEKMFAKSKIKEIESDINQQFRKIESLGGVIKGVDPILVDFLSVYEGRYIWLCWKEDEETIMFWHEVDEGFAGRKPIEIIEKDLIDS